MAQEEDCSIKDSQTKGEKPMHTHNESALVRVLKALQKAGNAGLTVDKLHYLASRGKHFLKYEECDAALTALHKARLVKRPKGRWAISLKGRETLETIPAFRQPSLSDGRVAFLRLAWKHGATKGFAIRDMVRWMKRAGRAPTENAVKILCTRLKTEGFLAQLVPHGNYYPLRHPWQEPAAPRTPAPQPTRKAAPKAAPQATVAEQSLVKTTPLPVPVLPALPTQAVGSPKGRRRTEEECVACENALEEVLKLHPQGIGRQKLLWHTIVGKLKQSDAQELASLQRLIDAKRAWRDKDQSLYFLGQPPMKAPALLATMRKETTSNILQASSVPTPTNGITPTQLMN
jgi:hypothetical protein